MSRLTRDEKIKFVEGLQKEMDEAKSFIMSRYMGLSVDEITEIRRELRKNNVDMKVMKNTLVKIALQNKGYKEEAAKLAGPIAYYFDKEDEIRPIKIIKELSKKYDKLEFVAGILEDKFYNEAQLEELSKIPSKNELVAKLVGSLNSPIYGFYYAMRYNLAALLRALDGIREKKEQTN